MDFNKIELSISKFSEEMQKASQKHWDAIAKPLGGLGILEKDIAKIAGMIGSTDINLDKRAIVVMCSDNGVVEEGVSQDGQDITAIVASNMAKGDASVCRMADVAGAKVFPVNLGMVFDAPGTLDRQIAPQTANFTKSPAMTVEQTNRAIQIGIDVVHELVEQGYKIFATGEMGIGNTTTSSALCSVLMNCEPQKVTGRGAGLSDAGLRKKISAIERGIEFNNPNPDDPFDVLSKLGGFDIAGLVGVFLGAALEGCPVILDGFISATAALIASRLCPSCKNYMIASHLSAEPAARMVLEELGLEPLIYARMKLGEGTGAVCAFPLLDMALAVYSEMVTFDETGIEAYVPLGGEDELEG